MTRPVTKNTINVRLAPSNSPARSNTLLENHNNKSIIVPNQSCPYSLCRFKLLPRIAVLVFTS